MPADHWKVFLKAVGNRRYGLADTAKLVGVVAAAAYVYWYGREMSTWELSLSIATAILCLLLWIVLDYALKLSRQIADARHEIAALRSEGVALRNKGLDQVWDKATLDEWEAEVLVWNLKVLSELEKISRSDAVWFSTLDVVPPARLTPSRMPKNPHTPAFLKLFREHDFRVLRLGEMIRDLWGRT
jgi:hypothetical protein